LFFESGGGDTLVVFASADAEGDRLKPRVVVHNFDAVLEAAVAKGER
jgi:hypothetical protein